MNVNALWNILKKNQVYLKCEPVKCIWNENTCWNVSSELCWALSPVQMSS